MVAALMALGLFLLLYIVPLAVSAAHYRISGIGAGWRTADRSSAGLLPRATDNPAAVVRIFAAQTVRWRGVFATHCWLVIKPLGATAYTRYDYTAWGAPIRMNGFEPDGRWFGHIPETVLAADGPAAESLIPRLQAAITGYAFGNVGDYRAWPGPNSNTFIAALLDAIPEVAVALPNTAIGKDFPYDGRWIRQTPSGSGLRLSLGGFVGLTVAWVEGVELNILGAVAGVDLRHPALKLPGLGRIGLPSGPARIGWASARRVAAD